MKPGLRERLEARRHALAESVAERVLETSLAEVGADLAALRELEAVIAALPQARPRPPVAPILIGLASVLLVSAAWIIPISALGIRTPIVLEASSSSLELTLARDWRWTGSIDLEPGRLRLEDAAARFSDPALMPDGATADDDLLIKADRLRMEGLESAAGMRIAFETTPDAGIGVFFRGGHGGGAASIAGNGTVTGAGLARAFAFDVPRQQSFGAPGPSALRASVEFQPARPIELSGMEAAAVTFGRLASVEEGFVSGLRSGLLRLPDSAESHDLLDGQAVQLESFGGRVSRLQIGGDGVELALQGTVSRVAIIGQVSARDLTPSLLSYLYTNQRLAFLFGAISFLWATLWSARRLFAS